MPKSWEEVKPRICELYEVHSLTRVQEILAKEHQFKASIRSYRSYLKAWGVLKTGTSTTVKPSGPHVCPNVQACGIEESSRSSVATARTIDTSASECGPHAQQLSVNELLCLTGGSWERPGVGKVLTATGASVNDTDDHSHQILHRAIKSRAHTQGLASDLETARAIHAMIMDDEFISTPMFLQLSTIFELLTSSSHWVSSEQLQQNVRALLSMLTQSFSNSTASAIPRVLYAFILNSWCMFCLKPMDATVRDLAHDCLAWLLVAAPDDLATQYSSSELSTRFGCECCSLLEFCTSHSSRFTGYDLLDKVLCAHLTSDEILLQSLFTRDCPARLASGERRSVFASLRRMIHEIPAHRKNTIIDSMLKGYVLDKPNFSSDTLEAQYLNDVNESIMEIMNSANMNLGSYPKRLSRLRLLSQITDSAASFRLAETMLVQDSLFVQHFERNYHLYQWKWLFLEPFKQSLGHDLVLCLQGKIVHVFTKLMIEGTVGPLPPEDEKARWVAALRMRNQVGLPDLPLDNGKISEYMHVSTAQSMDRPAKRPRKHHMPESRLFGRGGEIALLPDSPIPDEMIYQELMGEMCQSFWAA